ncbi:hypothetical protein EGH21_21925 [Halomicroarcula sp. F13]|uniref:DUF6884 domain-containing protein n=1 Tax=Haloarcula rubra TaxID=2487747 RepID=A0AAW4Q043_9EURY|nr:DUF6884 domain-containing protein [Halomicroarcula rubra]MBX0325679.1 hypothetical protein [Halomicroarcula rubra]
MEIGLVSCTKSKREDAAPPQDLYDGSAFFRKARQYARANHDDWYILSAKHGLLEPDGKPIEPYDDTLSGASVERKRDWSETVDTQLQDKGLLRDGTQFVFHAGRDYYDELIPLLDDADATISIETPTDGLQYGETLVWYNDHL